MRLRFWKKEPKSEQAPTLVLNVWNLNKMKDQFERGDFKVVMGELNSHSGFVARPAISIDPYDIEPAFHVRYEEVKLSPTIDYISIKAIRNNIRMAKLQVREVFVDPKRVARRHWHHYMQNRRAERIVQDSRLFV